MTLDLKHLFKILSSLLFYIKQHIKCILIYCYHYYFSLLAVLKRTNKLNVGSKLLQRSGLFQALN